MKVTFLTRSLLRFVVRSQRGATAAEYAIMATLIAMVIIAAVAALGLATNGLFQSVVNNMP
jgi:pilus assembly protein Flp/PilA